jgi:CRP-like cAMP-binding protein
MAILGLPTLALLVNKFSQRSNLGPDEIQAVLNIPFRLANIRAGAYLVREGDRVESCIAVLSGFVCRSKLAGDGARQILSIHLAGDLIDLHSGFLDVADHCVQALTAAEVAIIPSRAISNVSEVFPAVAQALWRETLVDGSIFREWLLNTGRRNARGRIAHLLCELVIRQQAAGLVESPDYELRMTQEQIGDATGLTAVHVNRTIQSMRGDGFVTTGKRSVIVVNWQQLQTAGDFNSAYLHLPALAARQGRAMTSSPAERGNQTSPSGRDLQLHPLQ